jgi:hypothetical protein
MGTPVMVDALEIEQTLLNQVSLQTRMDNWCTFVFSVGDKCETEYGSNPVQR